MSYYVNSYRVYMTMENDEVIEWEGYAEDEENAEGLAIEYAKHRTDSQVYQTMEVEVFDQFEVLTEAEALDNYDEMIDDTNREVEVLGYFYSPSYVLKTIDETAYRCGFSDYCDSLLDNHQLVEGYF